MKLSKSSNEILEQYFFFSYPPKGMSEKEFIDLKISWLIKTTRWVNWKLFKTKWAIWW